MVTDKQLEELIELLVPKIYQPVFKVENEGPVLGISLVSPEEIQVYNRVKDRHCFKLFGVTTDMYQLWVNVGLDTEKAEKWKDKFSIVINREQSLDELKMTLLHEIGHVDHIVALCEEGFWNQRCREVVDYSDVEGKERYADCFAFILLDHQYGIDEAIRILKSTSIVYKEKPKDGKRTNSNPLLRQLLN